MDLEFRLARKGEIARQKEIWKLCFGDPDWYIDFYYANRYQEEITALLLQEELIVSMLTILPVQTVFPDRRRVKTAMLYAIATHPSYQKQGFAAQLMDFSSQHLRALNYESTVLVPAEKHLFDFYRKQGYRTGFNLRETSLTSDDIVNLSRTISDIPCQISEITPAEYNRRREYQLDGRIHIAYREEDIAYQKKLSQKMGAGIYGLDLESVQGCFTAERIHAGKLLIKELLVPEELLKPALLEINRQLPAKDYILRTPVYLGGDLDGAARPFGMIRRLGKSEAEIEEKMDNLDNPGYLGLAFD